MCIFVNISIAHICWNAFVDIHLNKVPEFMNKNLLIISLEMLRLASYITKSGPLQTCFLARMLGMSSCSFYLFIFSAGSQRKCISYHQSLCIPLKTAGFSKFSGGIERNQRHEMNQVIWNLMWSNASQGKKLIP